jgi:hypothetical protein
MPAVNKDRLGIPVDLFIAYRVLFIERVTILFQPFPGCFNIPFFKKPPELRMLHQLRLEREIEAAAHVERYKSTCYAWLSQQLPGCLHRTQRRQHSQKKCRVVPGFLFSANINGMHQRRKLLFEFGHWIWVLQALCSGQVSSAPHLLFSR